MARAVVMVWFCARSTCSLSEPFAFSAPITNTRYKARFSARLFGTSKSKDDMSEKEIKAVDIRSELDNAFDYEGRLPSTRSISPDFRSGFVGIIGAPNMGKSTLLNALIEMDLCVATNRPQTTRHSILGVLTTTESQLCFLDTPGVIEDPAYKLQEGMMEAVKGVLKSSDIRVIVTDLFSTPIPDDELFSKVQKSQKQKPCIVVVNKCDLADKVNPNAKVNSEEGRTVTIVDAVAKWRGFLPDAMAIIPVSASNGPNDPGVVAVRRLLTGGPGLPAALRDLGRTVPGMFAYGVKGLTDEDAKLMLPKSPPLYDEETLTDRSERYVKKQSLWIGLICHSFQ